LPGKNIFRGEFCGSAHNGLKNACAAAIGGISRGNGRPRGDVIFYLFDT
jgi:hypothetical protein